MMNMLIYSDKPGGRRHRKFNFYPMNIIEEKVHGWQSTVIKSFQQELTDFVKLCEGKQGIIADGFSGFRAVEIADAVYRSTVEKQMNATSGYFVITSFTDSSSRESATIISMPATTQ